MARAADVEAGRAYVTFYLRRVNYDQQVDKLERDNKRLEDERANELPARSSHALSRTQNRSTEAGVQVPKSLASDLANAAMFGAASRTGSSLLLKVIPALKETSTAAAIAAPAVASVGAAATATAPAMAATATAATAAAPAIAASGTAAAGASVGFGALVAAAAPVLIPLAAIAAAAGLVYVAFAKWDKLPSWAKALLLVLSPLVVVCRALALAVNMLRIAVKTILLPFTLAAKAVGLLTSAITAIPRAIASIPGLFYKVGAAGWEMGKRVGSAAKTMAVEVGKAAAFTIATLARLPGRLAGFASDAIEGVSSSIRGIGIGIAKVGGIAAGLSAAIVGPVTLGAKGWAAYGDKIRQVQNDLLRFQLTAEEASIIARVSEQTGESTQKLAEQIRDGTRDFSRWRNELQQSGMLMSGAGLGAALALSRAYYSLRESITGLRNALGAALGPKLTETAQMLTGLVHGVTRWISENKPLVVQVFKIASAVGIAATAVTTLGGAVAGAGALLTPFAASLAAIAGGLAIVEVRTEAGRSIWAAYGDSVRRVWGTISTYLGQMFGFATKVIQGVKDALIAGDLSAAVDVMWAGAKVAWISALREIDTLTGGTFGGILQSLAAGRWAAAGEGVMNALQQAWITGVGVLSGLWDRVVDAADTAWVAIQNGFDAAMSTMFNSLQSWGAEFLGWMSSGVLLPLAKSVNEYSSQAASPLFSAAIKAKTLSSEIKAGISSSDEFVVRQHQRSDALVDRQAARFGAADDARMQRETEIEALRRRQAELATQGDFASQQDLTENQKALDEAIAAAKAARDAADASRLKEEDFAVSTKTQSIARFSGEALGLSVGRGEDSVKKTARLNEEQLSELRTLVKEMRETHKEILRLQSLGGFA